jgi:hypothetical protein
MSNEIAAVNVKEGDVFSVLVNEKYFFMQVINLEKKVIDPSGRSEKIGNNFYVIVFQKIFKTLPKSIDELDLKNIYQPKYIWKNTLFYAKIWSEDQNIKFDNQLMYYDYKDKYKLTFFANTKISTEFNPRISSQFPLQTPAAHSSVDYDDLDISPQPLAIQVLIWAIEQEEKGKTKKIKSVIPLYFPAWLGYVEPDCILKIEKIIFSFINADASKNSQKELKKAVLAINKLDEKYNCIYTIEAEQIHEKLNEIATSKNIKSVEANQIIDLNREW